jgi:predicted permease
MTGFGDSMSNDIGYAIRGLRKTPGFTAVVVISMALGIAASTTVFSMVNATLLGTLPVRDPRGLYTINGGNTYSYPEYRDFRDQCANVFQSVAGHFPLAPANLSGQRTPERVWGALVTGNYFSVAGPPLALGRGITPGEDAVPGRDAVVVLSDALWRRRFGADAGILGKPVFLNARRYTVVGVTAPGFVGTDRGLIAEFWAPMAMRNGFVADLAKDIESRNAHWIVITGRLKPGVTRAQAVAALNVVDARNQKTYRPNERNRRPVTLDLAGGFPGEGAAVAGFMTLLMAVAGLVLLIACANVANLLLARAVERRKEIGIRLAVGAGRGRLIRQLLTESLVLAAIGAAGGFALAFAAASTLSNFRLPLPIPFALDFTPDLRVLGFTAALAVVASLAAGLAPAIVATNTDLVAAVKGVSVGPAFFRRFGLRNLLVGLQVTLSAVLLIGSGLFLRSLGNAASIDLGIRPENTLIMAVDPKTAGYSDERLREFLRQLETRVGAVPGVRSVAASNILPLSFAQNGDAFREDGAETSKTTDADIFAVTSGYFETIGIPLRRGRNFNPATDGSKPVAVVSQNLARRMFGDGDPIGRVIRAGDKKPLEIVGVAGDSKSVTLGEEVKACVYIYLPRGATGDVMSLLGMTVLVKTTGNPSGMIRPVREAIEQIDPALAVFNVETMEHHVASAFLIPRLCAALFGTFGLTGLALAGVGLYGVAAYSVRSRTREIGIRMALGARPASVLRLVTAQGLGIVLAGLAIGLAASWGLSRFTSSLLYGLSATDPVTFLAVPAVLAATALVALLVPARRASALNPMTALRSD